MTGFFLVSCGSDDDICTSGEATPRMLLKFKTQTTGNVRTMDSIFVSVDYGDGKVEVINRKIATDSVFIPLRVDESPSTAIFVSTDSINSANPSKITFNYTTKTAYVSPACGIKKTYENLNGTLENPNPVVAIEQNQNEIINEDKTHFYLLF